VLTILHSAKKKVFFENLLALGKEKKFKKNSLPSACFLDTRQSWETGQNWLRFSSFVECFFAIALGKRRLCRVLLSAK
jgi:hypothetical protein